MNQGAPAPRRSLHEEPLLHFVVLGAALFGLHGAVGGEPRSDERPPIVVSDEFVAALVAQHTRRSGRAPDDDERDHLVQRHVRDEALYREGRALGLDQGDTIVRRRIVQKVEFLLRGLVDVPEPSDADLRAWVRAHPERYRRAPTAALTHIFFSRDRRGGGARADAEAALAELGGPEAPERAPERGDPFLLQYDMARQSADELSARLGEGFGAAVLALEAGVWSGPVRSSYGFHLVRVTERDDGGPASLEAVRERVRREWEEKARDDGLEAAVQELVDGYEVDRGAETT